MENSSISILFIQHLEGTSYLLLLVLLGLTLILHVPSIMQPLRFAMTNTNAPWGKQAAKIKPGVFSGYAVVSNTLFEKPCCERLVGDANQLLSGKLHTKNQKP